MKKFKNVLLVALFFVTATVLGQTKLTGTVVDEMGEPLPGANVVVKGTMNGTATDFDGKFTLNAKSNSGLLVVSFIGYINKEVSYSSSKTNLGTVQLEMSNTLDEIVVTATSFAIDRKTPVAVSTIKAEEIETKLGTQEFPEILKSTPGVYATKQGGGYGDSRINLRGFRSQNVAVMINGVPVNDMENGNVYWSNWAGLSDVTSAMQVQRGLGASKVAVPSVGGTINILSKSTDAEKGGMVRASTANDGYQKYGMTLSTGLMDNGLAITASAATIKGDGYVDGLWFKGFNYFLNVAKKINDNHKLSFTVFGAQQEHGQRFNRTTVAVNRATERGGKRFNPDWGYRNGQIENSSFNYYHKPQISLNYDWIISDKTFLTTVLYTSFGKGGGRRSNPGSSKFAFGVDQDEYRLGGFDSPINYDKIVEENKARGTQGSSDVFLNSVNNHNWYGVLSTFKTDLTDELTFSGGLDGRYYEGIHYYEVADLLGGDFYINEYRRTNNEGEALKVGDRLRYDYVGRVLRYGYFAQLEYSKNDLSLFLASSMSNTEYNKTNNLNDALNPNGRDSEDVSFLGYSIKGGSNYNIDANHNVFANVGYFSRAPFLAASVFSRRESGSINEDAVNEKVFSAEIGYGFRSEKLSANVNLYRTEWLDRSRVISGQPDPISGQIPVANVTGLDALHQGVELDFVYKMTDNLKLTGMVSLGDWNWTSDASGDLFDGEGNFISQTNIYADGLKVSDAAQTTWALGLNYKAAQRTSFFVDYNYAGNNYATMDVVRRTNIDDRENTWQLPNFHLFDLGFSHGFTIGDFDSTLSGKLNNILNTEYISDARDGSTHTVNDSQVYYGAGRTFSLGLKVKF